MGTAERTQTTDLLTRAVVEGAPERRPMTRVEFERAAEMGFFGPEERLELIGGEVVRKMTPQHSRHSTAIRRAEEALREAFPQGFDVRVQLPLALGDRSEPEPDLAVVPGSFSDYEDHHPATAVLVVEIADTTLAFDRRTKASLYAWAGIREYWIVNLPDGVLEVHRDPGPMADQPFGHHYRSLTRHPADETLSPDAAPAVSLSVSRLFR